MALMFQLTGVTRKIAYDTIGGFWTQVTWSLLALGFSPTGGSFQSDHGRCRGFRSDRIACG